MFACIYVVGNNLVLCCYKEWTWIVEGWSLASPISKQQRDNGVNKNEALRCCRLAMHSWQAMQRTASRRPAALG